MLLQPDESVCPLLLRLALPDDDGFFQQLFAANHSYFANSGLPEVMVQQLLHQQFQLQQQSYQQQTPKPECYLLTLQQQPVGRLILARHPHYLHLTDLALLPVYSGQGLGSALIKHLQHYARQQKLGLSLLVEQQNNGALQFYLRHGFQLQSQNGNHLQLCWQ